MGEIDELSMLIFRHFPDQSTRYPYCSYCRLQFENRVEWADHIARLVNKSRINWPARCYIYGTYGYALQQTITRAARHRQKMWLYQAPFEGRLVWVSSWDPKPSTPSMEDTWEDWVKGILTKTLRHQYLSFREGLASA